MIQVSVHECDSRGKDVKVSVREIKSSTEEHGYFHIMDIHVMDEMHLLAYFNGDRAQMYNAVQAIQHQLDEVLDRIVQRAHEEEDDLAWL